MNKQQDVNNRVNKHTHIMSSSTATGVYVYEVIEYHTLTTIHDLVTLDDDNVTAVYDTLEQAMRKAHERAVVYLSEFNRNQQSPVTTITSIDAAAASLTYDCQLGEGGYIVTEPTTTVAHFEPMCTHFFVRKHRVIMSDAV